MEGADSGQLLRIFIGEDDRLEGKPLYEAILHTAREMELGGGTVLRGIAGFGAASVMHTTRLLRLSHDLPVVIEVVESEERLQPFIQRVEQMIDRADCGALITVERAEVIRYLPRVGR
jgi:PII-like signaling protein